VELFKNILLFLFLIVILDQCGLWLERRGHLYWRKKKPKNTGDANALIELASFFNPGAKHQIVIEEEAELTEENNEKDGLDLKFK